jgi:poly-gamma-glutamate capsule biosynthesis protein CapA/YwtB (metallophosphatase superfamily)
MTFVSTGDSFITRCFPKSSANTSLKNLASLMKEADVRFTNLEVTVHDYEGFPSAFSGGTWAIADPKVLKDIKDYGFNLVAWANNHTMDYSYGGLEATEKYLNKYQFIHAGVGKNLAEASRPKYLECATGRVALIAATSSFHESWIAGEQRKDMMGRPGVNPLRYTTTYIVQPSHMKLLKNIAQLTDINAENNLAVKEGFMVENEGEFKFGHYQFAEGDMEGATTKPNQKDLERIIDSIEEAKRQADYVLVSIHSHEMKGEHKDQPADFIRMFAKECIDSGAHAIIGHGPHILRGIEIYKNRPIFYSLGNFIFQNETVEKLPTDFYEKYGLDNRNNIADAYDIRTENNTKGLGVNPDVWNSIVPFWNMQNGELQELTLHPIELGFGVPRYERGWPKLAEDYKIIEQINRLSIPFGSSVDSKGILHW